MTLVNWMVDARPCNVIDMLRRVRNRRTIIIIIIIILLFFAAVYPHAPIISVGPENATVEAGGTATFECRVMSDLQPHIQWLKHYSVNGSYVDDDAEPYVHVVHVRSSIDRSLLSPHISVDAVVDRYVSSGISGAQRRESELRES